MPPLKADSAGASNMATLNPIAKEEDGDGDEDDQERDSVSDLWNMDRDMTPEEVTAALAEEKRRKKVWRESN